MAEVADTDESCACCGRHYRTQEAATRKMLRALEESGSLTASHEAQTAMLIGMSQAVDDHPDRGALWREFRIALTAFLAEFRGAGPDALTQLQQILGDDEGNSGNYGPNGI